tara:strand:+ start:1218 stop:3290 length:2073 start_codon:yes stop_codon:yes gene_type:complete
MKLVYCAQFRDTSGYANAARGYVRAINEYLKTHELSFDLKLHDISLENKSVLNQEDKDLINKYEFVSEDEIKSFTEEKYIFLWHQPAPMASWGENLQLQNQPKWRLYKHLMDASTINVNLTTWEADRVPSWWTDTWKRYNTKALICPSTYNKNASFCKFEGRCFVVPHVVEYSDITPEPIDLPINLEEKFVVFSMSQWNSRKGFDKLIPAFAMEFGRNKDAVLVLKTNGNMMGTLEQTKQENQHLAQQIQELRNVVYMADGKPSQANILLVPDIIPYKNILWLHDQADVFALPTRGEGFGLTIAEACMRGKPVIVSNYGGHMDFINSATSFLVNGLLEPYVAKPEYTCEMNWFEPSLSSVRSCLAGAYKRHKALPAMGANAKKHIESVGLDRYSIGQKLYSTLSLLAIENGITTRIRDNGEDLKRVASKKSIEIVKKRKELKQSIKEIGYSKKDAMALLKNSFEGETCYIMSCGPSLKDVTNTELRSKLETGVVIAVKQSINEAPDLVDFHMFNCANLPNAKPEGHYIYDCYPKPIVVASSNYDQGFRWHIPQEVDLFFKIPIRTEINNEFLCLTKEFEKFAFDNSLTRPCGPGIMLETVIPMAVHLGCKEIVVIGWDLSAKQISNQNIEEYEHFFGSTKDLVNRGDILEWEVKANVDASKELNEWLQSRGVTLKLWSKQSALHESIERI